MNKNTVIKNLSRKVREDGIVETEMAKALDKNTKTRFLSRMAKDQIIDTFVNSTCNDNLTVGQISNNCTTYIALSLVPALGRLALLKTFNVDEETAIANKGVKYVGLKINSTDELEDINKYCTDNKPMLITEIFRGLDDKLFKEMASCDLNNSENIAKIYFDINVVYRMYQEMTIDAAKKAFAVKVIVILEGYRPLSLQKYSHNFDYNNKDDEFCIAPNTNHANDIELFQDPMNEIQEDLATLTEKLVNKVFESEIAMPDSEQNRLLDFMGQGPVFDLVHSVKYTYAALTGQHQKVIESIDLLEDFTGDENKEARSLERKRYQKSLNVLSILPRQLLEGFNNSDKASIMQLIACMDASGKTFNKFSGSQIAVALLAEEYMDMILHSEEAEIKVMGYKIAVDMGLEIGSFVEFNFGISDNGSILDFGKEIEYANGTFKIEEYDGRKYATKPLVFNAPKADFTKRVFCVKAASYKNSESVGDQLIEGSSIVVDAIGNIKNGGVKIGKVKYEVDSKIKEGRTIQSLLGVRGVVSFLNVIDGGKEYDDTIIFELSNVEELEVEEVFMGDVEEESTLGIVEELTQDSDIVEYLEPESSFESSFNFSM